MASEALLLKRAPASRQHPLSWDTGSEQSRRRVNLGGVLVDQLDFSGAAARLQSFLTSGRSHQVVTVNLDFLSIAQRQLRFREAINRSDLAVADGMPLVWLSRLRGTPLPQRVTGVDLVEESCRIAAGSGRSVFLLGAGPGVAQLAAAELRLRHPGLRVAGTYSPPMGPLNGRENKKIVAMIRGASPDFVFVALGAPRQDLWIRDNLDALQVPVAMGVGCVFDLLAGSVRRAPVWLQQAGFEWAFRIAQEPLRLWRRYLVDDLPVFARLLLASRLEPEALVVLT